MCWPCSGFKSKEFVELCNKNGHCVSYDTVLRIETKWADDMLAKDEGYSCIPSNIVCNQFIQAVSDNSDYGQEDASQYISITILLQYTNGYNFNSNVVTNVPTPKQTRRKSIVLKTLPLLDLTFNKNPVTPSIDINNVLPSRKSFARETMQSIDYYYYY